MRLEDLKKRFYGIVYPSLPNEWEVEDVLSGLLELPEQQMESLVQQVSAIWPVSHSLCFAYLEDGRKSISYIPADLVGDWTREVLDLYETGGLVAARRFMADPERLFLGPKEGRYGLNFSEVQQTMQLYLDGISGGGLELAVGEKPQTDTKIIKVPQFLDLFVQKEQNFLLYKFLISLQWQHVDSRLFEHVLEQFGSIKDDQPLFASYSDTARARDLFFIGQTIVSLYRLRSQLPGLVRSFIPLYQEMIDSINATGVDVSFCEAVKELLVQPLAIRDIKKQQILKTVVSGGILGGLPDLYHFFQGKKGGCNFGTFSLILGHYNFREAISEVKARRAETKDRFVSLLAQELNQGKAHDSDGTEQKNLKQITDSSRLLVSDEELSGPEKLRDELLLDNSGVELSQELKDLITDIEADLGELPEAYVQAAAGMAGRGVNTREPELVGDSWCEGGAGLVGYPYDEWDYRRGGYRKQWCTLYEKPLSPVRSTFIEETLRKYSGQLQRIRRQFEMLRTQQRFVRRRRHGDDIDLDALIDALGDSKAGLAPSDRLFLRLLRDRREISTSFLVDMSNSTEGWVGNAMKESLVLLAEAMEIAGDPYAIYGFSGMRRSKSELYPIKELEELYSQEVKERIAAISPREYTRMGPPVRHLTRKMLDVDSRTRLIIVFSDGKPEDYDDYKGAYAIEDTRKAILEARGCGIRVFCITIDKSAHEYLAHMFGRGHYVFVDNVESLPGKLVEMYRLLTC